MALATTLAWIVTRTDTPFRGLLELLITLPFFIPGLLEAIAWIELLSPNAGTLNVWLKSTLGLQQSPLNIYSLGGMIWVMALGSTSFIFLLVVNALRNMDASLEESARTSGAGAMRTALTVTLPLMAPIILSAGMLSFIRAMDSFEVPVLLGLPAKVFVFSNRIYAAVQYDYPVNYGLATALGVSFFALMIGLIYVQNRLLHGRSFSIVTGKGYKPRVVRLGRFRYVTLGFCVVFFGIATALPLSQVIIGSFLKVFGLPRWDLFTFDNYLAILSDATLWRGLINTFIVCGLAAAITVLLSTMVAYINTRTLFVGRRALDVISWLPWAIPGIVAGLGMLWAYITLPFPLYGTLLLLVIVLVTTGLPLGVRLMSGRDGPARARAGGKLARARRELAVHLPPHRGAVAQASPGGCVLAVVRRLLARGERDDPVCRPGHGAAGGDAVQLQPGGPLRHRVGAGDRADGDQYDRPGGRAAARSLRR